MSYTFQILCDCQSMMRYDRQFYLDTGIMKWFCWNCENSVDTTCLLETVIP